MMDSMNIFNENSNVEKISSMRKSGGILEWGSIRYYFPRAFGFCYGVDRAIDMVFRACERFEGRVIYLTDELIHNPWINKKLAEKGVHYLKRNSQHLLECDCLKNQDVVVISAFGTHFKDVENLKSKGVTIVDCTCGAIISVWRRVARYATDGFITVIHGKRHHEETRATLSQARREGGEWIAIENEKEAVRLVDVICQKTSLADFALSYQEAVSGGLLNKPFDWKIGMANQTTMLQEESMAIQQVLRRALVSRFGEGEIEKRFRAFDTICGATQDRQEALRDLLKEPLDCLLIVGGFNSSNTAHLADIASFSPVSFFHIESADNIISRSEIHARDPKTCQLTLYKDWLAFEAQHIGITSGASTPDATLLEIIKKIKDL